MIFFPDKAHLIVFLVVRLIILVLYILFLVNLQQTLKSISFSNRKLEPGLVWLSLIPIFNFVWPFIMNVKISQSIKKEMEEHQGPSDYDNYALPMGVTYPSVMVILAFLPYFVDEPFPYAWIIGNMITLICLGIFWYQTAEYKKDIREMSESNAEVNYAIKNDLLDGF